MIKYLSVIAYALVSITAFSVICRDSIANGERVATAIPSCCEGTMACKLADASCCEKENPSPRISFEKTFFDLGDVGQGTKNTCEFRFTNTGSAAGGLKIGNISRTCGCTVFHLDKKEYARGLLK